MLLDQLRADVSSLETNRAFKRPPGNPGSDSRVVIVTMTLARSPSESQRLYASLRVLARVGLPIYVGEGGSSREFVSRISRIAHVRVCPLPSDTKPTLVKQLRNAFAQAQQMDPDYVVYTEPDKTSFFREGLPDLIRTAQPPSAAKAGLMLAGRNQRGFASFPKGQQVAESFMNQLCGEALGQAGDYTYGPMLIGKHLLPYIQLMPANLGWGWRFFLMALAHQLRINIGLLSVRHQCPRSQRGEDDFRARDYRVRQLVENVTGLANGWTFLLDQPAEQISPARAAA